MTTDLVKGLFGGLLASGSRCERDEGAVILVGQIDGADFAKLIKVIAQLLFRDRLVHNTAHVQRRHAAGAKARGGGEGGKGGRREKKNE